MAYIYSHVKGRKITKFLAVMPEVQAELKTVVDEAKVRAEADLARHRHDGHAYITTEKGKVDHYLVLSDERGQKAAMSIEYGREPDPDTGNGGMDGLFILHRAMELPRRKRR